MGLPVGGFPNISPVFVPESQSNHKFISFDNSIFMDKLWFVSAVIVAEANFFTPSGPFFISGGRIGLCTTKLCERILYATYRLPF